MNRQKYMCQTVMLDDIQKKLWSEWRSDGVALEDIKIFSTIRNYQCVKPAMTYGAESWTTKEHLEQKLKTAQGATQFLKMLNITIWDKIRNSKIR